jgi:hypothetical protein
MHGFVHALAVLALALLAGCSQHPATSTGGASPAPSAPPRSTIRVATHSPLSGSLAALGEGIRLASQLAVEQGAGALARSGFSVEVVAFDDEARPDVGIANARRIVSDPSILAVAGRAVLGTDRGRAPGEDAAAGPALSRPGLTAGRCGRPPSCAGNRRARSA